MWGDLTMPVRFGAEPADEDDGHAKTSEDEGPRQRRKCGEEIERKKDGVRTHELERSKGGKSTADARGTRATIMSTSASAMKKKDFPSLHNPSDLGQATP